MPLAGCARFGYEELLSAGADANGGGPSGGSAGTGSGGGGAGGGDSGRGGDGGAGGAGANGSGGAGASPSEAGASGSGGSAGSDWDGGSPADSGSTPDPTPTCTDTLQNQDETSVDCGGSCAPCPCTFGAPELMGDPNLSGNDILAVSLSSDALTMYLAGRIQGGAGPIAVTTRPNRGNNFSFASTLAAPVNSSPSVEGTPFLSRDELALYFYSQRAGGAGERDLYVATRASTAAAFNSVSALTSLESPQRDHSPALSPDSLTIYFSSRRASASDDLWRATRSTPGVAFSAPAPVTELNSSGNDTGITISDDELVAYFASDRAGGLGGMDLYRAARATATDPFSAPALVAGLSTGANDAAPQLTADGLELFFVSDRNGSDTQLFRVTPICP
jgi:WD40 repeat protein